MRVARKALGYLILLGIFALVFAGCAAQDGVLMAVMIFGSAAVLTVLIVYAVRLIDG